MIQCRSAQQSLLHRLIDTYREVLGDFEGVLLPASLAQVNGQEVQKCASKLLLILQLSVPRRL